MFPEVYLPVLFVIMDGYGLRPVRIPKEKIDWMFFRENTEGAYVLGQRGIAVTDDLTFDFKVITSQGAERIIRRVPGNRM